VEVVKSELSDEKQSAIDLDMGAKCKVFGCDIGKCGVSGVCVRASCDGEFQGNTIHDMPLVGIQIESQDVQMHEKEIWTCERYGIHILNGVQPQVGDNNIHDNLDDDLMMI
jgi:hypothetical protein